MVNRRGTSATGCLFQILILGGLVYGGMHIGQPYYRYYRYRDAINQQARFAILRSDDSVRKDILANADSLALPQAAYYVQIARTEHGIHIWVSYTDSWTVWRYTRPVYFTIDVKRAL